MADKEAQAKGASVDSPSTTKKSGKKPSRKQYEKNEHTQGPLVAFINGRSGGNQGVKLFSKLVGFLGEDQVFDLADGGPRPGLTRFLESHGTQGFRVLACGGDGTACWLLSELDRMLPKQHYPPVGVLALGTGNDLSRTLEWGPGYRNEPLPPILRDIDNASLIPMDRWLVRIDPFTEAELAEMAAADRSDSRRSRFPFKRRAKKSPSSSSGVVAAAAAAATAESAVAASTDDDDGEEQLSGRRSRVFSKEAAAAGGSSNVSISSKKAETKADPRKKTKKTKKTNAGKSKGKAEASEAVVSDDNERKKVGKGKGKDDEEDEDDDEEDEDDDEEEIVFNRRTRFVMNNYFGIGTDAEVALRFHEKREAHPHRFKSRAVNKGWYGAFGMQAGMGKEMSLRDHVTVWLDGEPLPLSKKLRGIIVLNLPSWGGGIDLWGSKGLQREPRGGEPDTTAASETSDAAKPVAEGEETSSSSSSRRFRPLSLDDGLFEVLGVRGAFHVGSIVSGLGRASRLGQGSRIQVECRRQVAVQADGEPWRMEPGRIEISHHNKACMLFNDKGTRRQARRQKLTSSAGVHFIDSIPGLDALVRNLSFDLRTVNKLKKEFMDASGGLGSLSHEAFVKVMRGVRDSDTPVLTEWKLEEETHDIFLEKLFAAFDTDGNGLVDFQEYLCGLSTLCSDDFEAKLQFTFQIYDVDGDGYITEKELHQMLRATSRLYELDESEDSKVADAIDTFLRGLEFCNHNEAGEGVLNMQQFKLLALSDPVVTALFALSSPADAIPDDDDEDDE
eukprot:CAMPEP_0174238350 /NCGR_PEP_ID=MMETSP0417-20130205/11078_1 /TAXON_ID=242541 /ORGANISM="Mayorella sp, Strain BSH-02190019" /LENGTH=785 /DNA_ID=CAMNT_0015317179 /DNA_START=263 /DNA_END=2617 /DNA_ORIENTATION=+